jgi:hypothetical protein
LWLQYVVEAAMSFMVVLLGMPKLVLALVTKHIVGRAGGRHAYRGARVVVVRS